MRDATKRGCCLKCAHPEGFCAYPTCPCHYKPQDIQPEWDNSLIRAIELCIGVRGNKALDGSYAGPREAFRQVLEKLLQDHKQKILEGIEYKTLDVILYIGDEIPEAVANDPRPKFVLLGTPREYLDSLLTPSGEKTP